MSRHASSITICNQLKYYIQFVLLTLMILTDYIGSLLGVLDHSSQPHYPRTFHVRKRAEVHHVRKSVAILIRVGNGPCWPLLLPW